jgi:hypothetical protein
MMANSGIPLGEWSGSNATRELESTIREFNASAERQTRQMLRLTWVIAALTAVMTVGVVVQIYLAYLALR